MRLTKHKRSTMTSMDMTPMIDVVFLLLIFFMTVSQVSNVNREQLELPKLEGTKDQQEGPLVVNVDAEGQIIVEGQRLSAPQLAVWMDREIARRGEEPSTLKVTVRGDAASDARAVNEVVRTLNRLGVLQIRMAVQKPQ
ncbi:MAG TPA: biopolymer transporter ExbD [Pirellulaceae bacterium]|jgi:biopolymer transport protein ExbD|nr:biopolymer transporter ExbD [Pirellulaceae bacterium]